MKHIFKSYVDEALGQSSTTLNGCPKLDLYGLVACHRPWINDCKELCLKMTWGRLHYHKVARLNGRNRMEDLASFWACCFSDCVIYTSHIAANHSASGFSANWFSFFGGLHEAVVIQTVQTVLVVGLVIRGLTNVAKQLYHSKVEEHLSFIWFICIVY